MKLTIVKPKVVKIKAECPKCKAKIKIEEDRVEIEYELGSYLHTTLVDNEFTCNCMTRLRVKE